MTELNVSETNDSEIPLQKIKKVKRDVASMLNHGKSR